MYVISELLQVLVGTVVDVLPIAAIIFGLSEDRRR